MNKFSIMKGNLVGTALILSMTLLSACTILGTSASSLIGGNSTTPTNASLTACHATGDPANPYEEIDITYDISPVPANGCPAGPVLISDGKITICHATDSQTNPYEEISVSVVGLNGHGTHAGDVFPLPEGGCPTSPGVIGDDLTTPTSICHATGDPANPYEELTVNTAELNVHRGHPNDINPVPNGGCPTSSDMAYPGTINTGQITICHATSSQNNPYNQITVSVNGLNGHGNHEGDIIPAPEAGCPTDAPSKRPQNNKPQNNKPPTGKP